MNNHRLLTGFVTITLLCGGMCAYCQPVITLEEIFDCAETNSAQLRPSISAQKEAESEISVARAARLPEITTSLSLSYIGDGFTTKRNLRDYQRAPIPHFGNALSINVT
ncbi:MAG: TolC family protein, partial [Muribaculaceae bacterium]|nr:TolC family protein [Muribaculaceae bacterium]